MTVARDAVLESSFSTVTPFSYTFTPTGTPKGIIVAIAHGTPNTDVITGVTYGGVTMTRIDSAVYGSGEVGRSYLYFLGASIPTGAQSVSITHTGSATVKWVITASQTAAANTEIVTFSKLETNTTTPQIALDTGGTSSLRYAVIYSGTNNPSNLVVISGMEANAAADSHDFGNFCAAYGQQTTAASGSVTIGWTIGVTDVNAMVAVAVQEVVAGTVVTPAVVASVAALPTPTILAASTTTPAVVPIVAALPTPLIAAAALVTPATIAAVVALPTPTIGVDAVVAPAVIAVTTVLPTPNVLAAAKVTPAVIPLVVTLPTPTTPTIVQPAVVAVTAALPTPSILAASKVTPAVIPLVALLPTPTVVGGASAIATPAVIAASVGLPTPAISVDAVVTPAGIALVVTLPIPGVTTPGLVTPAGISLIVTLPTPLATVGAITFWEPDPVAFVRIGPGDEPPWN